MQKRLLKDRHAWSCPRQTGHPTFASERMNCLGDFNRNPCEDGFRCSPQTRPRAEPERFWRPADCRYPPTLSQTSEDNWVSVRSKVIVRSCNLCYYPLSLP